jgi:hypothetical protein
MPMRHVNEETKGLIERDWIKASASGKTGARDIGELIIWKSD